MILFIFAFVYGVRFPLFFFKKLKWANCPIFIFGCITANLLIFDCLLQLVSVSKFSPCQFGRNIVSYVIYLVKLAIGLTKTSRTNTPNQTMILFLPCLLGHYLLKKGSDLLFLPDKFPDLEVTLFVIFFWYCFALINFSPCASRLTSLIP